MLKFAIVLENSIAMLTVCLGDPANLVNFAPDKDIISCEHVAHVSTQTSSLDCDVQQQINLVSTVHPNSVPEGRDLSWFQTKSNDELFQAQKQDPVLKHLFSLKEKYKDEPPKWQEIWFILVQWMRIEIVTGDLYRNVDKNSDRRQLLVPKCWQNEILVLVT